MINMDRRGIRTVGMLYSTLKVEQKIGAVQ